MTTEGLLVHAITRGLCVADFHEMSIGMIMDYIMRYDNLHERKEEKVIQVAGQSEFNIF